MRASLHAELVLQALLAAVWSRKPKPGLMLHSDQGTQYTSHDWQSFLKDHGIVCSMSRCGNCHDNAVIESFHQLIKRERIRRKIYATRAAARSDVFDYIELFYNPKRRRGSAGARSPVEFERQTGLSGRYVFANNLFNEDYTQYAWSNSSPNVTDAWKDFPENIRAVIQLATVHVAWFVEEERRALVERSTAAESEQRRDLMSRLDAWRTEEEAATRAATRRRPRRSRATARTRCAPSSSRSWWTCASATSS